MEGVWWSGLFLLFVHRWGQMPCVHGDLMWQLKGLHRGFNKGIPTALLPPPCIKIMVGCVQISATQARSPSCFLPHSSAYPQVLRKSEAAWEAGGEAVSRPECCSLLNEGQKLLLEPLSGSYKGREPQLEKRGRDQEEAPQDAYGTDPCLGWLWDSWAEM